ncbi:MAG: Lin1244/Lin1753 domain-containing protein [Patescibacteria group bacterium]|jgi:hypothetical protein
MARSKKIGLDYFPLDVTFNEQIQALETLHGNNGLVWILKFWQSAYKTEHGEVNLNGLFGDLSANNARLSPEQQTKIIADCIQLGLLVEISRGVYTSNGVRKRIAEVSKEREYAINYRKKELLGEQSPNNPQTMGESRVKESRVEERKEKIIPPTPPKGGLPFEQFWKAYPKKTGKGAAEKAWLKIKCPVETVLNIISALQWQVKSEQWTKEHGQFIPMPATYINQRRWEDEPPPPPPQASYGPRYQNPNDIDNGPVATPEEIRQALGGYYVPREDRPAGEGLDT